MQLRDNLFTSDEWRRIRYILIQHMFVTAASMQQAKHDGSESQFVALLHENLQATEGLLKRVNSLLDSNAHAVNVSSNSDFRFGNRKHLKRKLQ